MNKTEKSLLLFFETAMVDYAGRFDPRHINAADRKIMSEWEKENFISCGRVSGANVMDSSSQRVSWVQLSDSAMDMAHKFRKERAKRMWEDKKWRTTREIL